MTEIEDYRHPASGVPKSKQEDVATELEALMNESRNMMETNSVLEILADQLREAE